MAPYFVAVSQSVCVWMFSFIFVFQGQAILCAINGSAVIKCSAINCMRMVGKCQVSAVAYIDCLVDRVAPTLLIFVFQSL